MSDLVKKADHFKKRLKKLFGAQTLDECHIEPAFKEAQIMAEKAGALHIEARIVPYAAEEERKRVPRAAEVLFVRFGQGLEAAWVAFVVFEGGWANVYRPMTPHTADMPWLDAYLAKEFAG